MPIGCVQRWRRCNVGRAYLIGNVSFRAGFTGLDFVQHDWLPAAAIAEVGDADTCATARGDDERGDFCVARGLSESSCVDAERGTKSYGFYKGVWRKAAIDPSERHQAFDQPRRNLVVPTYSDLLHGRQSQCLA